MHYDMQTLCRVARVRVAGGVMAMAMSMFDEFVWRLRDAQGVMVDLLGFSLMTWFDLLTELVATVAHTVVGPVINRTAVIRSNVNGYGTV